MQKQTYQSVDEYIADQPKEVAAALEQVRAMILKAVPDTEQLLNYNIPAFTLTAGGKRSVQFPLNKAMPKDLIVKMVLWRKQHLNG